MKRIIVMVLAASFSMMALAEPIDGRKRVLCTTTELQDCVAGSECLKGLPAEYGAPTSLRIDFANRQVLGERRKSKIRDLEKSNGQILLQGLEMGFGWTIGIDSKSGEMTVSLVNREGAFVLFGSCSAL